MQGTWRQLIVAVGAVLILALANAEAVSAQTASPPAESAKPFTDTAEMAMRVTEASAKDAIDTIKEIYAIVGIVAAIVVSVAAFFGLREYRQVREGGEKMVQDALRRSKKEFEERLEDELEELREMGSERIHKTMLISLDTSDLPRTLTDYKAAIDQDEKQADPDEKQADPDEKQYLRGALIERFKDLEDNANALKNERTLSWVWAERALMSYYEKDLSEAYRYQKMAVAADKLNHIDRHHNLAAIGARLYSEHRNRNELLSEAAKELEIVLRDGSRWEVRSALRDSDLDIVFRTQPKLRQRFEERAPGAADDGTG
jgi:hypothetical protein